MSMTEEQLRAHNISVCAPALMKGDAIFFHGRTVHGSINSQDDENSRMSFTCHSIPQRNFEILHKTKPYHATLDKFSNIIIYRPKDLNLLINRIVFRLKILYRGL
jgi:hypothetical protein